MIDQGRVMIYWLLY